MSQQRDPVADDKQENKREENEDDDEKDKQKTAAVDEKPEDRPLSRVTSFTVLCCRDSYLAAFKIFIYEHVSTKRMAYLSCLSFSNQLD